MLQKIDKILRGKSVSNRTFKFYNSKNIKKKLRNDSAILRQCLLFPWANLTHGPS